ncbi:helix-turn-helix transcriptional regulator [Brachybacterium tyrofermentans]|uniref:helix-turn-helix transcriptional regulator n=1 Tax=Brachybacterium tyrofermentans TaxID=47848 RepID=UPI003F8E8C1B
MNDTIGRIDQTGNRPMTTPELSKASGIPVGTLRYWRHAGIGPRSFSLGRSVRYDPADVEEWFEAMKERTSRGGVA